MTEHYRIVGCDPDTRELGVAIFHGAHKPSLHPWRLRDDPINRLADAHDAAQVLVDRQTIVIIEHPAGRYVPRALLEVIGAFKAGCSHAAWVHPGMPPGVWKLGSVGKGNASKDEVRAWAVDTYGLAHYTSQNTLDAVAIAHAGRAWWESRKETAA